jgi:hypothetical protein
VSFFMASGGLSWGIGQVDAPLGSSIRWIGAIIADL